MTLFFILLVLAGCAFNDEVLSNGSCITHTSGGWFASKIRGSGKLTTVDRSEILKYAATVFRAVELSGIGTLTIEEGERERFEVTAEDNIVDKVSTEVIDGVLICQLRSGFSYELHHPKGIHYKLTLNKARLHLFRLMRAQGSTRINAMIKWESEAVACEAEGASHISLDHVLTTNMNITMEGASRMKAKTLGIANVCSIEAEGATLLDVEQLSADDADCVIEVQGSSKIDIAAGSVRSCKIDADGAAAVRANNVHCAEHPSVNVDGAASVHINGTKYTRKW